MPLKSTEINQINWFNNTLQDCTKTLKMKLMQAFMAILPLNFSLAKPTDHLLASEPLLHYARVGYLSDRLSQMGVARKAVLIQQITNRNAVILRQVIKQLVSKENSKAVKPQRKHNLQNKRRNRLNRYKKFHSN